MTPGRDGPPHPRILTAGPVPPVLRAGPQTVTVTRAWPTDRTTGPDLRYVTVEGTDDDGRVRAARVGLRVPADGPGGPGWELAHTDLAAPGTDRRLPALAAATATGEVVVHRYARRAVVRLPDRFVKTVRAGKGQEIGARAEQGRDIAAAAGFDAPRVLLATGDRVDFTVLRGRTLHQLGARTPLPQWDRWWHTWARQWPALTAADRPGLPVHDGPAEAAVLRRWLGFVQTFHALPADLRPGYHRQVTDTVTALTQDPGQPLVVAHRDLHDKQLLVDGDRFGILDFDTVSRAEPALDLANLLVHLRLRADQGRWSPAHARSAARHVQQVAAELGVDRQRLALYARATWLRLIAVYAFRPAHRGLALAWARRTPDEEDLILASWVPHVDRAGSET